MSFMLLPPPEKENQKAKLVGNIAFGLFTYAVRPIQGEKVR